MTRKRGGGGHGLKGLRGKESLLIDNNEFILYYASFFLITLLIFFSLITFIDKSYMFPDFVMLIFIT